MDWLVNRWRVHPGAVSKTIFVRCSDRIEVVRRSRLNVRHQRQHSKSLGRQQNVEESLRAGQQEHTVAEGALTCKKKTKQKIGSFRRRHCAREL